MARGAKTYELQGIENKETFQVMDPNTGETHEWVAVDVINAINVVDIFPGAQVVPLTQQTVLAAPTVQNPNVVSGYAGENQPFPTNRFVAVKVALIEPLVSLTERESASLQVARLDIRVGNNAFDGIDVADILTSRARPVPCVTGGTAAMCSPDNAFGDNRVDDRAAIPAFVLSGQEDFIVNLSSLLPTGFFVDAGRIDPLDPTQQRQAIPVKFLVRGYYIARKGSMADNASRFRQINMNPGQGVPAPMSGVRR